tara:strand:+ start:1063 stop:3123 length:2061 start_codon:yes stop_codon:yes gene_type:complete
MNDDDLFAAYETPGGVVGTAAVDSTPKSTDVGSYDDLFVAFEPGPAKPERGTMDIFTGSERIADNPELGTLPEFGNTKEGDTWGIFLRMLTTFDPKAQREMIKEAIPEVNFNVLDDGTTIVEAPIGDGSLRRSVLNRPGFSTQDFTTAAGQVLEFLPAAKLASLGKTIFKKAAIGGFGAGATEQALQETGIALGREERDPLATGVTAVTGGVSEVVVPAVQAFRASRAASGVNAPAEEFVQMAPVITKAEEASKATGIPLFQAQKTLSPAQLEKQSFVMQLPAGTQTAVKAIGKQNRAAGDAVENFINSIAPSDSVITGAERVRTAAQRTIEAAKTARMEAASPIYKQAFRLQRRGKIPLIDTKALQAKVGGIIEQFDSKGQIYNNLTNVQAKIVAAGGDLKKLHSAKIEIDQTISSIGADSVGNTTKRYLVDLKNDLVGALVDQSPSYRAAKMEFAKRTPDVIKIQDSIIGKVAGLSDVNLKQASTKLFDASQTNPKVLADAKKAIRDVDPSAWDEIVRVEFERRLGSVKSVEEPGATANIPGELYRALFPNDKSTKVLMGAMNKEGLENLKFLRTALGRAKLGRGTGSQTAARGDIKDSLAGGAWNSISTWIASPIAGTLGAGSETLLNRRAAILSKTLFDPQWKAEMKKIRAFSPNSPAGARAMTQLLNDVEANSTPKDGEEE